MRRRRRFVAGVLGGLLLACFVYCIAAPNQYEATARVELRAAPVSSLNLDGAEAQVPTSILSAPIALETLASVLRSDRLAWRIIVALKLYSAPGFCGDFNSRFPGFDPAKPTPEAQAWLLDRFSRRLRVQSMPRTLLVEIRFRSHDAALSAAVVNALIAAYGEQETESQIQATAQASGWLTAQLADLKTRVDSDQQRLAAFEAEHGIVSTPDVLANGQPGETEHNSALLEIDELSRQLVAATSDRILAEAEYRAASEGDPETVIASDPHLQAVNANFATALLEQIHARRSDLEQEQAQLSAEHGPAFREWSKSAASCRISTARSRPKTQSSWNASARNWQTALDREQLVRDSLRQATARHEAERGRNGIRRHAAGGQRQPRLYCACWKKSEEAGLAAGVQAPISRWWTMRASRSSRCAPDLAALSGHHFLCRALDRGWSALAAARRSARPAMRVSGGLLVAGTRRRCPSMSTPRRPRRALPAALGRRQLSAIAGDPEPAQSQGSARGLE